MKYHKKNRRLLVFMILSCLGTMNVVGQDLQKHQWENRILIVKSKNEDSRKYQKQLKEMEHSINDLTERRLIVYSIIEEEYEQLDLKENGLSAKGKGKVSPALYDRILNKDTDFEIILIGLDGSVKLQSEEVLLVQELNGLIDSMPMRKQEISRKELKH